MLKITEDEILKVIAITEEIGAIRYIPHRKTYISSAIENSTDGENKALAFFCWFCIFNNRFKAIDASRYNYIPVSTSNEAGFSDFLSIIRTLESKRITLKNEAGLANFISKCGATHRKFYMSILSKDFIKVYPMTEVQTLLPIDKINMNMVYGNIAELELPLSSLKFPVAIRSIPEGASSMFVLSKEGAYDSIKIKEGEELTPIPLTAEVKLDLTFTSTPKFTVVGYIYKSWLFPFDFFNSFKEYTKIEHSTLSYPERVKELNRHLDRSMPVCMDGSKVSIVEDEHGIRNALINSIGNSGSSTVLITDENSSTTGQALKIDCRIANGVIEDLWSQEDKILGFTVWFNGSIHNCAYEFTGKERALLNNVSSLKNRVVSFYYVKVGIYSYLIGKEVLWHQGRWRTTRLRGTYIWIDKCALCGDTKWKHVNHGFCKSCEANLPYYFTKYGTDTWILPSSQMTAKRKASSWEPSLLNAVKYMHKGTLIEANETGAWRFSEKKGEE